MKLRLSIRFFVYLGIAVAIMVTAFLFSSQPAPESDQASNGIIELLQRLFGPAILRIDPELLVVLVRKGAHFTEYLLLGLFLSLAGKEYRRCRDIRPVFPFRTALLCTGIAALYAVTDELHQMLVPLRSGQLSDVCLDAAGAFLGALLVFLFSRAASCRIAKEC